MSFIWFWNSNKYISDSGFITSFNGNLKNSNYRAEKTSDYKSEEDNYEILCHLDKKSYILKQ